MDPRFPNTFFPVDTLTWLVGALITAGLGWILTRKKNSKQTQDSSTADVIEKPFIENQNLEELNTNLTYPELVLTAFTNWMNQLTMRKFIQTTSIHGSPAVLLADQENSEFQVGIRGQENGTFHLTFLYKDSSIPTSFRMFRSKPDNLEQMLNLFLSALTDELSSNALFKRLPIYELQADAILSSYQLLGVLDDSYSKISGLWDESDLYSTANKIKKYLEQIDQVQARNDPSVLDKWTTKQWEQAAYG